MNDLRLAFRGIRKQPGFAAVAVLTLAFGHRRQHQHLRHRQRLVPAAAAREGLRTSS